MAGEFEKTELGNLLSFANGRSSPDRADGLPYPVYGSNGVIGYADDASADANTIIIGRVGSYCGSLHLSKQRCWVTDNAIRASARDGNDPRFLFYLLGTLDLNDWRAGSGQPLLNQDILNRIPTAVPKLSEQRAIAHVFGAMDDKIDLNRRTNETLEAMARALFKSWFVDFDPVRAKVEGRNPELPTSLAELFPGSFEDSELGRIPRGWEVKPIRELIGLSRESIVPGNHADEVFDHYSIPAYDQGGMPHPELGSAIRSNKYIVFCDSVLLSKLNPRFPRVWLPMLSEARRSICSTEFLVVRPKSPWTREFVYSLLRSDRFIGEFSSLVTGTSGSHQRVRPQAFLSLPVVCPQPKIAEALDSLVSNWLHRGAQARSESRRLAALRDTLLPKLISGELRVKNAERFLEERPSAGY